MTTLERAVEAVTLRLPGGSIAETEDWPKEIVLAVLRAIREADEGMDRQLMDAFVTVRAPYTIDSRKRAKEARAAGDERKDYFESGAACGYSSGSLDELRAMYTAAIDHLLEQAG